MHSRIRLGQGLGVVLRYHERKVKQKQAECLYAGNMLKDTEQLSAKEKQYHLERLHSLNERVKKKTLHIFLSWPSDDVLDNEKMRKIAREYVEKMGLGNQPYLIYRHWDAVHAHAHIVTTNIRPDGTKISIWQKEMLHSLELSRELELKHGLYQAGRRVSDEEWARKHPVQKVVYGITPLKPTMNAVLEHILPVYRFTTLDELNAVLRPYHIRATQGAAQAVTRRNNGLLYFPLNSKGEMEDVYIKASALRCKPTLRHLQERFAENHVLREKVQQRVETAIDWIFYQQPATMEGLRQALQKERINIVRDGEGIGGARRIFYIDELTKNVYDGQTLGPSYSAEGIAKRCISEDEYQQQLRERQRQKQEQKQRRRQRLRHDLD